ncbi:putative indole-3-pyruvate monooxygenase YUCCA10 [Carex littledalei]|uniref:Flavin-containing monooxygenase n=1 Tax=Carex littledalei TaxID=544730 RepID=A0A833QSW1_9POAL|nr:putative indole-3-pyruvate monooxygenase YUCCA10 [Carex littledalei]
MEAKENECQHQQEELVLIVGAGPSGLAVAACLAQRGVPSLILERDNCIGPLWRKRTYNRISLHLAKQYCSLPHLPHSETTPTYIPKSEFISYLDSYAERFHLRICFGRQVESALYDHKSGRWILKARNGDVLEEYVGRYLVVAAGENNEKVVPDVNGLESFKGVAIHSSEYRTGSAFKGKDVLVVGAGNSGMEIAFDLFEAGARTSVVVRSPIHIVNKEIYLFGMRLMNYLPMSIVDQIMLLLCYLRFGNTAKYGLRRPDIGPMYMKFNTPIYPVVDVGTYDRIKTGEIQVLPSLTSIQGNMVTFSNGKTHHFDAIIFATGYRSTIRQWLETDDEGLIGDDGMAKNKYPGHWKGRNGFYCTGLIRNGLHGSSEDGLLIANDISNEYIISKEANGVKFDE